MHFTAQEVSREMLLSFRKNVLKLILIGAFLHIHFTFSQDFLIISDFRAIVICNCMEYENNNAPSEWIRVQCPFNT